MCFHGLVLGYGLFETQIKESKEAFIAMRYFKSLFASTFTKQGFFELQNEFASLVVIGVSTLVLIWMS